MAEPARQHVPFIDFLVMELRSELKHEWLDGEIHAMAGGSRLHALLQARLVTSFSNALVPRGCQVYGSDLMVRIPETGLATYPDLTVVCGAFVGDEENPEAATNPIVLIEVLSPSTERWDRGGKFWHYQRLPSLRAYLMVEQAEQRAWCHERTEDGAWTVKAVGPEESILLGCLDLSLPLATVYVDTGIPIRDPQEPEPDDTPVRFAPRR